MNPHIMFLYIILHPVFIQCTVPVFVYKHNVLEAGFCLRLQVKPTQLSPVDRASPYSRTLVPSIDLDQMSRFYLKTETESSLRNAVFINKNRTVFYIKTERLTMFRNIIFILM
jgi:hypothetical protein